MSSQSVWRSRQLLLFSIPLAFEDKLLPYLWGISLEVEASISELRAYERFDRPSEWTDMALG
jgi:hypothetical protein